MDDGAVPRSAADVTKSTAILVHRRAAHEDASVITHEVDAEELEVDRQFESSPTIHF